MSGGREVSRRQFTSAVAAVASVTGLSATGATEALAQTGASDDEVLHETAVIAGLSGERDEIDLGLDDPGTRKNLIFIEADTGRRWVALAKRDDPDWQEVSLKAPKIETERAAIAGVEAIQAGDDIQAVLDSATKRAITVEVSGQTAFAPGDTIIIGQNTRIVGEAAGLTDQPESDSSWDFSPRPVFDFSGAAIDGFESDPNANYRAHHPYLERVVAVGSGDANGAAGVRFSTNSNGTKVGLPQVLDCNFSDFQTGIDGTGTVDSLHVQDTAFRNCEKAITNTATELRVRGCTFWHFTNATNPICVEPSGARTRIHDCEIEPGGGSGATSATRVVVPRNGASVMVYGNTVRDQYDRFVDLIGGDAGPAIVSDNTIGGTANASGAVVDASGGDAGLTCTANTFVGSASSYYVRADTDARVIGNDFTDADTATPSDGMMLVDGTGAIVAWNTFPSGAVASVKVTSAAADAYLWGVFPDGVNDNGTRTRINGVAEEALGGSPPSTPSNWNTGDVVEDTDNAGDAYLKLPSSGFTQIAT